MYQRWFLLRIPRSGLLPRSSAAKNSCTFEFSKLGSFNTPADIEAVRVSFEQSPGQWSIHHAQALRMSDGTVQQILHNLHSYKTAIILELQHQDFERRLAFAETMIGMIIPLNGCVQNLAKRRENIQRKMRFHTKPFKSNNKLH